MDFRQSHVKNKILHLAQSHFPSILKSLRNSTFQSSLSLCTRLTSTNQKIQLQNLLNQKTFQDLEQWWTHHSQNQDQEKLFKLNASWQLAFLSTASQSSSTFQKSFTFSPLHHAMDSCQPLPQRSQNQGRNASWTRSNQVIHLSLL